VLKLLDRLEKLGVKVDRTDTADTADMPDTTRMNLYLSSLVAAVLQKTEVRREFGSNRNPGLTFGREVPALRVLENGICVDLYPQRRSMVDKQRVTIEAYLENAIKTLEFFAAGGHLEEAKLAYKNGLYGAAVVLSLLALDGFIWRALWGRKDMRLVGPDNKAHPFSSVDFVYQYGRKSRTDFPFPEQFDQMKIRNPDLFKQLRDSDSFLLRQAIKEGIIKPHEVDMVSRLRVLRNFCSHFNPYEKTLEQFQKSIEALGLARLHSFSDLKAVAEVTMKRTEELLTDWRSRVPV